MVWLGSYQDSLKRVNKFHDAVWFWRALVFIGNVDAKVRKLLNEDFGSVFLLINGSGDGLFGTQAFDRFWFLGVAHFSCEKLLATLLVLKRDFKGRFSILNIHLANYQAIFYDFKAHNCPFSSAHWISLQLNNSLSFPSHSFTALKLKHLDSLSHCVNLMASVDWCYPVHPVLLNWVLGLLEHIDVRWHVGIKVFGQLREAVMELSNVPYSL
jgi:hypothetical protein